MSWFAYNVILDLGQSCKIPTSIIKLGRRFGVSRRIVARGYNKMNNLNETLTLILEKTKKFRSLYEQNEMAVRDQLVNPMLRAIGWDPENPNEVQPNVSTEEGIPDYSLIKKQKRLLFVEAKKLSVDVEQRDIMSQLARYSFAEGTRYGLLTNGVVWILVRSFEEGTKLSERVVWKTDLENEQTTAVCRKLMTVSKDNVEQIESLVKRTQILSEVWQSLLDEPDELVKGLMPVVKSLLIEGYPNIQFEDTEVGELLRERIRDVIRGTTEVISEEMEEEISRGGEKPRTMKLAGEIFELRNSWEILTNTATWLIKKGKLKPSDCPVGTGSKRNLVNTQPKHKYGDGFLSPKKLSNGLWLETHYSTTSCIYYAKRLLERFGVSPDSLAVE